MSPLAEVAVMKLTNEVLVVEACGGSSNRHSSHRQCGDDERDRVQLASGAEQ